MRNFYFLLAVIFLFLPSLVKAQNFTNYNLYNSNNLLYNPAGFIPNEKVFGFANYHSQWLNINGAPNTQSVGVAYKRFPNMGFGLSISNYSAGMIHNLSVLAGYGYQINFDDSSHYLKMGVSMGVANEGLNTSLAQHVELNDNVLNNNYFNRTMFSSGFGAIYYFQNLEAGVALPKLYDHNRLFNQANVLLSYKYKYNDDIVFKPSVFYNYVRDFQSDLDFNIMAYWKNLLWMQVGYRTSKSFIVGLGTKFYRYEIAYAFELDNNELSNVTYGSHELQLIYKIGNEKRKKNIEVVFSVIDKATDRPVSTNIKVEEQGNLYQSINTDDNGFARIKLKQGKSYQISIEDDKFYPVTDEFEVSIDSVRILRKYKLVPKTVTVTGVVKDIENKKSLGGANIKIMEGNKIVQTLTAENDGSFEATLNRYKDYQIIVAAKSHRVQKMSFNTRLDADKKILNFELQPFVTLSGKILETGSNKPVSSAEIKITDEKSGKKYNTTSDNKGLFKIEIEDLSATTLQVDISKKGYMYASYSVKIKTPYDDIKNNFSIEKISEGAKVVLENVVFDKGKSVLKESSLGEINKIVEIMKTNPDIRIELSGHTDNSGSYEANKKISKERAQAVADYMISKGIDPSRIVVIGYGPDNPRDSNDTPEGRERNRRVEAKVIK